MLGERLGVMDLDDLGQRRPIVLLAEIPAVRPGELGVGHALAGVGHALEAEVRGVGENRRQYAAWIVVDLAGTQVPEHRRKPGQRVDFPQELGDPDARQKAIDGAVQGPRLLRCRGFHQRHRQPVTLKRYAHQVSAAQASREAGQSLIEQACAPGQVTAQLDVHRQAVGFGGDLVLGKQVVAEPPVSPRALDPDVAGFEAVAQGRDWRGLVKPPGNLAAARLHQLLPAL